MKKLTNTLAILFAAAIMVMIMAVPAFADAGDGYYVIHDRTIPAYSTNQTITVKLAIESRAFSSTDGELINTVEDVELTGDTSYTVLDVLRQFNTDSSTIEIRNQLGQPLTTSDNFISSIKKGSKIYSYLFFEDIGNGEGRIPVDGWMFRVNGQVPLESEDGYNDGLEGAFIDATPVANGDVITLYFNCPFEIGGTDFSAGFVSAESSYSGNTLSVSLKTSHDNHCDLDHDEQWTISVNPCTTFYGNTTGYIYDSNWTQKGTITFNSTTGQGTTSINLTSGTYYLYVPSTQNWVQRQAYSSFSGSGTVSCYVLASTFVFDRIVI